MPNWCSNTVTFSASSEKEIRPFYNNVIKWFSKQKKEITNHHVDEKNPEWLGRALILSGLYESDKDGNIIENEKCPSCRAFMTEIGQLEENCFTMYYDSAWAPMIYLWKEIIEHFKYKIDITFHSEEPGCEIYVSNDPAYIDTNYIDYSLPSSEQDIDFMDQIETKNFLQRALKTDEEDFNKLLQMCNNFNNSELNNVYIYVHQIEEACVEDF